MKTFKDMSLWFPKDTPGTENKTCIFGKSEKTPPSIRREFIIHLFIKSFI